MKFMHISDVHLGAEPDVGKSWSKKRAQDIWDSFAETVKEAGRQQVDFLLISGDLFHRQPLKRELKEVNYLFEQIPQVKIVLMAGNHDHLQPKSYYLDFPWKENVYFFRTEEVSFFDFPKERISIYGMSYWHQQISDRIYDKIVPADTDRINILLAHGGETKQIPFAPRQILANGMDYIAAGHIHKGGQIVEGRAVMAGALEPIDCNDVGAHGYWIGKITKNDGNVQTDLAFYPIRKCEYHHETIFVEPHFTQLYLEKLVRECVEAGEKHVLYRIFLKGRVNPDSRYDFVRLAQIDQVVDVISDLRPDYDYEKMREEEPDSLLGRYIAELQKMPQNAVTRKALEYGVNALLGYENRRSKDF